MDQGGPVDRPFVHFPYSALDGSITDRFEATAARFSQRLALRDCSHGLTYGELASLVEHIAETVAAIVAERPGPIAILLPRDVHFPAAMLGVLAAGRGFVPLDATDPPERIAFIAMQSGAVALVSAGTLAGSARQLFSQGLPIVDLHTIADVPGRRPIRRPSADDLAFIVYTSGSTGRPKGAYHNHRNLLHDVMQQTNTLHLNEEDCVALLYSPAVIAAMREIFLTLLNGASLHILPPQQLQHAGLVREIRTRNITICRTVPPLLRRIAAALEPNERVDSVRVVGLGSQRVDWSDFDLFRRHFSPEAHLIVGIGATECGGNFCHWFVDERLRLAGRRLPIGRILPDAVVTIADAHGNSVPAGEVGELLVASRYLALGYWRDSELTARAFSTNPADPTTRIYKTGDMGRMRPDGLLEFAGRNDQQIKLRGHRVEIGEVELAISECVGVAEAAVVVRSDESGMPQSLAAYVELNGEAGEFLPSELLSSLSKRLPDFMLPAKLYVVDSLPRLPHLKIDRVRLKELDSVNQSARDGTVSDQKTSDRLADELVCIFERVIEMKGATTNDNVASLGGDSLHAEILFGEIEQKYNLVLPPEFYRQRRTIGEIAHWIASHDAAQRKSTAADNSVELTALTAELTACHAERRAPRIELGNAADWVQAVNYLLSTSRLDVAEHGLRHLRALFPSSTYAERVGAVMDHLPLQGTPLPFSDDAAKDVQIVSCDHAETVVLLFCGEAHKLGLPLPVIHTWLGRLKASLVYLRDFQRCYYLRGVRSLGSSREITLAKLQGIISSLGAKRVVCYGNSAGVFGALRYGLDLQAEAVLCMAGPTTLDPEFNAKSHRKERVASLREEMPEAEFDLRRAYLSATRPPRVHMAYGDNYPDDRRHAQRLDGLPFATLQPLPDFAEHNVVAELIKRGQLEELLSWLVPGSFSAATSLAKMSGT